MGGSRGGLDGKAGWGLIIPQPLAKALVVLKALTASHRLPFFEVVLSARNSGTSIHDRCRELFYMAN